MANRNYKRIERVIKSFSRNVEAEGSGDAKLEDDKRVSPSTETISVSPDEGYDGLKQVTVEAVTSTIDENIKAENIKKGVSILDVEGTFETPIQASKPATPSTETQEIVPDEGYEGLAKVVVASTPLMSGSATPTTSSQTFTPTGGALGFDSFTVQAVDPSQYQKPEVSVSVSPSTASQTITPSENEVFNVVNVSAVTSAIDQNIKASNIVSGVSILGVNGTYSVPLQSKSVNLTTSSATFTPDNGYSGFSQITVSAKLMSSTVTPTTTTQTVTPASGYVGFSRVRVNAVPTQTSWIYPSKAEWPGQNDTIYPDSGYYFSYVYVSRVDSSIDSNIQPENIKKDTVILGVTGTLEGGGIEEVTELPTSPVEGTIYELIDKGFEHTSIDMATYNLKKAKAVVIGDYIYIVAPNNNSIYKYNPLTKEISQDGYLPSGSDHYLYYAGVEAIEDKIYIFGGRVDEQPYSYYNTSIIIYDTATHTYQELYSQLTYAVANMATTVYKGKIWLFSGNDTSGSKVYAVQKFDTSTNTLSYIGSLPFSLSDMACCNDGKYIYLIGGRGGSGSGASDSYDCYKIEINKTETAFNSNPFTMLQYPVSGASAVYYQNQIYLVGNNSIMYSSGGPVWRYNENNLIWEHIEYNSSDPMEYIPTRYYYNSAVIFGNYIYSLGGVGDGEMYDYNYIYQISNAKLGTYTYLESVWYNITDPSGIVEVSELPTVGEEDKIYRVIETEVNDEGNYTASSDYNFRDATSAKFGDYIYFFNVADNMSMTSVDLKYNPTTKTFTQLDKSLVPDRFNKCAVVGNYIYLFKCEYSGTGYGYPVYKFDPSTDTYTQTMSSLSYNASGIVCHPMGTNILIVSTSMINSAYVYDTVNDTMTSVQVLFQDATTFSPYHRLASCVYGNSIYIFGLKEYAQLGSYDYYILKFTSGNFSSEMYTYNYKAELIKVSEEVGDYNSCGIIGNKAYIFGGRKGETSETVASDAIYEFDLNNNSLSLNSLTLPETCMNTFTVSLDSHTLYTMAEQTMSGNPPMESTLREIYTFTITQDSDYVYRNSAWLDIINGGGSGGVQVDKVSNLSASGTVISWTAPDTTAIAQYNPQLAYAISVDGTTVTTTTQTSIDLAQYLGSGSNTVAVTVVLTYTDIKNETITIAGKSELVEVELTNFESGGTRVYDNKGIAGFAKKYYNGMSYTSTVYLFGGQEYDPATSSYMLNKSCFSIYYNSLYEMSADTMTTPTFAVAKIVNAYGNDYVFSPINIYTFSYFSGSASFQNLNIGYPSDTYCPTVIPFTNNMGSACCYAFGGFDNYAILSSIYKLSNLGDMNPTFSQIQTLMPEGRFMAEALLSSSYFEGSMNKYDCYIIGGFSSLGSTPESMERASRILKFNCLNETFYSDFTNIIPSNVQIPVGHETDGRMNTHTINIQGKTYILGKDTTDNQMKLFEFDYASENLKSSGITLTNQNIKFIDTTETNTHTHYGVAIYKEPEHGDLHFEKIIANKLEKTTLSNDCFDSLTTKPDFGLTTIKNNHMYIFGASLATNPSTYTTIDVNLTTGEASQINFSGWSSDILTPGSSIVEDENYAYIVNTNIYRIDIENRSISSIGHMPVADIQNSLVLMYNGKIYKFGGARYESGSYTTYSDVYKIDIANGETEATKLSASLSNARFNAIGMISGHYAYIFGGWESESYNYTVNRIEKFDFDTDTFDTTYMIYSIGDFASGNRYLQDDNYCYNNPVFNINGEMYLKCYGEELELKYFDTTSENFYPSTIVSEEEMMKYVEEHTILCQDYYWKIFGKNSNSEIYAITEKQGTGEYPTFTNPLFKYSK